MGWWVPEDNKFIQQFWPNTDFCFMPIITVKYRYTLNVICNVCYRRWKEKKNCKSCRLQENMIHQKGQAKCCASQKYTKRCSKVKFKKANKSDKPTVKHSHSNKCMRMWKQTMKNNTTKSEAKSCHYQRWHMVARMKKMGLDPCTEGQALPGFVWFPFKLKDFKFFWKINQ